MRARLGYNGPRLFDASAQTVGFGYEGPIDEAAMLCEAVWLLKKMQEDGIVPDENTLHSCKQEENLP